MSLQQSCRLFGLSRQSVYQKKLYQQRRLQQLSLVKQMVIDQRRLLPTTGTRKLHYLLRKQLEERSIKLGRDGLFSFLKAEHLLIRPRRNYTRTTNSKHWLHKHENLVKGLVVDRSQQVWVADITYLDTKEKTAYLSLVTDAYSRKIVGYHLHPDLSTDGVVRAMQMACKGKTTNQPLIHHSDRGLQYCSRQYQALHEKNNIRCSGD